MATEEIIALAALASAVVGAYIKHSNDVAQLKQRMRNLEERESKIDGKLELLTASITRIEKALVKAGLIDIE
jgi:seryl-tRNA synthetase